MSSNDGRFAHKDTAIATEGARTECSHTPGPWSWWTSCSWKRLKRDDRGITQNVLEPYVCSDGHPDLSVSREDMALIAAAPDLFAQLSIARTMLANNAAYDYAQGHTEDADFASKAVVGFDAALLLARGGERV